MTKKELIKLSRENLRKSKQGSLCECYDKVFIKGYKLSAKRIAELKKENTKLKSECITCVYTGTPCVRSDYSSKNGVCDHYKNVLDENTKLKLKLEALEEQIPWKDIKDKSEVIGKIIRAKEIIKDLLQVLPKENIEVIYEITEEAKQFLREVEE